MIQNLSGSWKRSDSLHYVFVHMVSRSKKKVVFKKRFFFKIVFVCVFSSFSVFLPKFAVSFSVTFSNSFRWTRNAADYENYKKTLWQEAGSFRMYSELAQALDGSNLEPLGCGLDMAWMRTLGVFF